MEAINEGISYGQCRCCLAQGHHRDVVKEYYWNGIREVYSDIFMECFNLFLSATNITTLICTTCIQRLRDANSFRMMVVATEQQLLRAITHNGTMFVDVPDDELIVENDAEIKTEPGVDVKKESRVSFDDDHSGTVDCDVNSDDSDTALAKLKTCRSPVKGEGVLLSRFKPESLRPLPTRSTLYRSCPGYVRHLDLLRNKIITPKMIGHLLMKNEKRKKVSNSLFITEKYALIHNATTLLEFSNVTPFKTKTRSGFPCFYCKVVFENLKVLREHQSRKHVKNTSYIKKVVSKYSPDYLVIYVDVTDLKCLICDGGVRNLNELKTHLNGTHQKKLHTQFTDRIVPYKLTDFNYECQICACVYETFGSIERHMNVHYRNYVCEECGAGFVTKHRLRVHMLSTHVSGNFPCNQCKKTFSTHQKYKCHLNTVHKLVKKNKCSKCPERFMDYFTRHRHMVEAHGLAPLQYKCNVCDKIFNRRYSLSCHMKRKHLEEKDNQCQICSYRCFSMGEMRMHMIKHNGERLYECGVCKKSYARKKTLTEHMRIHNNDRRYACVVCGQAFVQNCSLKGHMKTHHMEYIHN